MGGTMLTVGIEDEFFIVDAATLRLAREASWQAYALRAPEGRTSPEQLRHQVEAATRAGRGVGVAEAVEQAWAMRGRLAEALAGEGKALLAAGTHPWGEEGGWEQAGERAAEQGRRMGRAAARAATCGMHVHVGGPWSWAQRIRIASRLRPWIPWLAAISGSSPFHDAARDPWPTGWCSYRWALRRALPRTGLPPRLEGEEDWCALDRLLAAEPGVDASRWHYDARASVHAPTVEVRCPDAIPERRWMEAVVAACVAVVALCASDETAGRALPAEDAVRGAVAAAARGDAAVRGPRAALVAPWEWASPRIRTRPDAGALWRRQGGRLIALLEAAAGPAAAGWLDRIPMLCAEPRAAAYARMGCAAALARQCAETAGGEQT